jgi:hypothetical protein
MDSCSRVSRDRSHADCSAHRALRRNQAPPSNWPLAGKCPSNSNGRACVARLRGGDTRATARQESVHECVPRARPQYCGVAETISPRGPAGQLAESSSCGQCCVASRAMRTRRSASIFFMCSASSRSLATVSSVGCCGLRGEQSCPNATSINSCILSII